MEAAVKVCSLSNDVNMFIAKLNCSVHHHALFCHDTPDSFHSHYYTEFVC